MFRLVRLHAFAFVLFCLTALHGYGQIVSAPDPQAGDITGSVTDVDGAGIPGADITVDGPELKDQRSATTDGAAVFSVPNVRTAVTLHITVRANGFAVWTSRDLTLTPGQSLKLPDIELAAGDVESVEAMDSVQMATLQVKNEEQQRIFGVIPNFYTSYDALFVPLTAKLKFQLALKASTDVVSVGAAAFVAGLNQAAGTPRFGQGMKGYGQRFGVAYANGASDILIGGAVLPSLLHQDPRYFYQGTGTKKSRALHAIAGPFVAKGDNGRWQPNYSSIGGDLASASLANTYYPPANRGVGLVFSSALITTGGRVANTLAQEFILRKLTSKSAGVNQQP